MRPPSGSRRSRRRRCSFLLFELLRKRPLKLRNLLILDLQLALECVALGPALLQLASQRACLASLTFQLGLGRSEL